MTFVMGGQFGEPESSAIATMFERLTFRPSVNFRPPTNVTKVSELDLATAANFCFTRCRPKNSVR